MAGDECDAFDGLETAAAAAMVDIVIIELLMRWLENRGDNGECCSGKFKDKMQKQRWVLE